VASGTDHPYNGPHDRQSGRGQLIGAASTPHAPGCRPVVVDADLVQVPVHRCRRADTSTSANYDAATGPNGWACGESFGRPRTSSVSEMNQRINRKPFGSHGAFDEPGAITGFYGAGEDQTELFSESAIAGCFPTRGSSPDSCWRIGFPAYQPLPSVWFAVTTEIVYIRPRRARLWSGPAPEVAK